MAVVLKQDSCEHFFLDLKDKPFCGHFPHDFKGDFPPKEILEALDPKTYSRERTLPPSDIVVKVRPPSQVSTPNFIEPQKPDKKPRKPREKKEPKPVETKIVVDEKPKIIETTVISEKQPKNVIYDFDEW